MSDGGLIALIRGRVLGTMFQLLYTRLSFLHETAGRLVYGSAWDGRRQHVVPPDGGGALLDIGCGEGRLLRMLDHGRVFVFGVEPSPVMARRARNRNVTAVQATAQSMPIRTGSVDHVVATYPGPWIIDPRTWTEIARVTVPGASVRVLLGGDYARGRGSFLRSRLLRMAYGRSTDGAHLPVLGNAQVPGAYVHKTDQWGTAILWSGVRVEASGASADRLE